MKKEAKEERKHLCRICKSEFNALIGLELHMIFKHGIELLSEIQRIDEQVKELREQQKLAEMIEPIEFKDLINRLKREKKSLKKFVPLTFKFVRDCQKKRNAVSMALQTLRR